MTAPVVLVTGGAGYVGAHACKALAEAGYLPVVYDDLSNGHAEFVRWGPLEVGDVRDRARLDAVFAAWPPVAVMHFAALIEVGESVLRPGDFFSVNVGGALTVIEAARSAGVDALVFSSTCAIYGPPQRLPLDEDHPQVPASPYGRSKLIVEQMLTDYERHAGFRSISLRYFNAAGADGDGLIGERHAPETHALPRMILTAIGEGESFQIFGGDYDTPDGTAVRDYIHVSDLAIAHVLAMKRLLDGGSGGALNLGTGQGLTVRQVLAAVERQAGRPLAVQTVDRRAGDVPVLVADARRAFETLGWTPALSFDDVVQTAWRWHASEIARTA